MHTVRLLWHCQAKSSQMMKNLPWTLPPVQSRDGPPTPANFHLNGPSITTSEGERETAKSTPNKDTTKATRREVSTETTRDV
jgi:hypothetical protein